MTTKEIADIVDAEGLEYAILEYLEEDDIDNPKLRKAFLKAKIGMEAMNAILKPLDFMEDEDGECED